MFLFQINAVILKKKKHSHKIKQQKLFSTLWLLIIEKQ